MNLDEKTYVNILNKLFTDTKNIKSHLLDEKQKNPNNWRPWVLFIIKIWQGIVKV